MKNNKWLISIFFLFLFAGCFEDESNYDISKLDAPVWNVDGSIFFSFRAGEIAKFRGTPYFTWTSDSAKRASEVTYEWKIGYTVVGNEADFEMQTDELIKKLGLTQLNGKELWGSFSIIEKETGISHYMNLRVSIDPTNASGDWFVVSRNGENTKLSFIRRKRTENNELTFELREDVYPDVNEGVISGRPLMASYAEGATNIGVIGALTIVTTSGRYEINCENMVKVGELEEVPFVGMVTGRHDAYYNSSEPEFGLQTFVMDADGKLYRRMMSKNNLGGAFGSTPLVLDSKGYKIQKFGLTPRGYMPVPCYDELNRRMVILLFYKSADMIFEEWFPGSGMGSWVPNGEEFQLSKLVQTQPAVGITVHDCAPVWDMPVGTKALHAWYVKYAGNPFTGNYNVMGLIYNDAAGKTWLTEFANDEKTGAAMNSSSDNRKIEFPGGNLQEGTYILTCTYTAYRKNNYILYSTGNQIRFLNRNAGFSDNAFITLPDAGDKVNYMAWTRTYSELMVCTENGNVIIYKCGSGDLSANPEIINQFNLGGSVVSAKELNNIEANGDRY